MKKRQLGIFAVVVGLLWLLAGTSQAVLIGTLISNPNAGANRQTTNGTLVDNMDDSFTILEAGGHDLWGNFDSIFFAYQDEVLTGDGEIIAQVRYDQSGGSWSRIGLSFRESLDPGSRQYSFELADIAGGRVEESHRHETGGGTENHTDLDNLGLDWRWLKLVRTGNFFQGFNSLDGENWTPHNEGHELANFGPDAYIGLLAHGRNDVSYTTATFRGLAGKLSQDDGFLESDAVFGFWDNPATWTGTVTGGVPTAMSIVEINGADSVTVRDATSVGLRLSIGNLDSELYPVNTASLTINSGAVLTLSSSVDIVSTLPTPLTVNGTLNAANLNAVDGSRISIGNGGTLALGGSGNMDLVSIGTGGTLSAGAELNANAVTIGSNALLSAGAGGSIDSITAAGPATISTGGELLVGRYTNGSGQFTKQGAGRLSLDNSAGNNVDLGDSIVVEGGTLLVKGGGNAWKAGASQFTLDGGTLSIGYSLQNVQTPGKADVLTEWYFDGEFDLTALNPLEFGLLSKTPVWGWGDTVVNGEAGQQDPLLTEGELDMAINFPGPVDLNDPPTPLEPLDDTLIDFNWRSNGLTGRDNLGALWLGFINVGDTSPKMNAPEQLLDGEPVKFYSFGTDSDEGSVVWIDQDKNGKFERDNDNGIDELVVNNPGGGTPQVGSIILPDTPFADDKYLIAIGYYNGTGEGSMGVRVAPRQEPNYFGMVDHFTTQGPDYINPGAIAPDGSLPQEGIWSGFGGTPAMPSVSGTALTVLSAGSGIQVVSDAAGGVDLTVAMHDGATLATLPGPVNGYNLTVNLVDGTPDVPFYVGFDPQTPTTYNINAAGQLMVIGKVGTGDWTLTEDPVTGLGAGSTWSVDGGTLVLGAADVLGGRDVTVTAEGTLDLGANPEWLGEDGVGPGNSKITLAGGKLMLKDSVAGLVTIEGFNDATGAGTVYDVTGGSNVSATEMWSLNENAIFPVYPFDGEEGEAYFVGVDLNNGAADRYVTFKPIDLAAVEGLDAANPLTLVVALAAQREDPWEDDVDFLKIQMDAEYIDDDADGTLDFSVDWEVVIKEDAALDDALFRIGPGGPDLFPTFADFAFPIPAGASTALGIRIQGWSSNQFEFMGFDNVRLGNSTQLDGSPLDITINGGGTIDTEFANADSTLPAVTLVNGLLTTTGTGVAFEAVNVVLDPEAAPEVGFDPQSPTDYGTINVGGQSVTIFKGGPSTWVMNRLQLSGAENAVWEVRDGTLQPQGTDPLLGRTDAFLGQSVKVVGTLIPANEELGTPEQYISGELLLLDDAETLLGAVPNMSTVTLAGGTVTVGDKVGSEPPEAPIMTTLKLEVTADSTFNAITTSELNIGLVTLKNGVIATSGSAKVNFVDGVFVSPLDASVDTVGLAANVATDFGVIDANNAAVNITLDGSVQLLLDKTPQNVGQATWEVLGGTTKLVDTDPLGDPLGGRDITVSGGRLVMDVTADGLPLGTSAVTLAGGELEIVAQTLGFEPGLLFGAIAENARPFNHDIPNPGNRGVDPLGPTISETNTKPPWADWTTYVYTGQIFDADGKISFYENVDDETYIMIDGREVLHETDWNSPDATGALEVTPGWVDFEVRFNGGGGGVGFVANNGTYGFGFDPDLDGSGPATGTDEANYTPPRNQAGQGDLFRVPTLDSIDLANIDVTVTADSTLSLRTPFTANVNELKLLNGIVTVTGAEEGVTFANTVIIPGEPGETVEVGVDFQVPVVLGILNATGVTGKFIKRGPFDLVLDGQVNGFTDVDGLTLVADEGQVIGIGGVDSMGTVTLGIGGGDLVLASRNDYEDVAYDSAVVVEGRGSLTAGSGGVGGVGPLVVTLGSPSKGVDLNGGTFNVRTTDGYRLQILGPITGSGSMNVLRGDVTADSAIEVDSLGINGTFTVGGVTTDNIDVNSGSTLNSAGPITATVLNVMGELNLTGEGDQRNVTINSGGELNLLGGNLDFEGGTLSMSEADLTIGFGYRLTYAKELTVANLNLFGTYRRGGVSSKGAKGPGDRNITIAPGGTLTLGSAAGGAILNMTGLTSGTLTADGANIIIEDGELTIDTPLRAANLEIYEGMVNTNNSEITVTGSLLLGPTLYVPADASSTIAVSGSIVPYESTVSFGGGQFNVTDVVPDGFTDQESVDLVVTADSILNLEGSESAAFGSLTLQDDLIIVTRDYTLEALSVGDITGVDGAVLNSEREVEMLIGGTISPGLDAGDLAKLMLNTGGELMDDATYRSEIGSAGSWPLFAPVLPGDIDPDDGGNDLLRADGNANIALGGRLDLVAVEKLHDPQGNVQWYGREYRTIVDTAQGTKVAWFFGLVPDTRPETFDSETLGRGHLGYGVFLVEPRPEDLDTDYLDMAPLPPSGVLYDQFRTGRLLDEGYRVAGDFVDVSLLQAADGDANGDEKVNFDDIRVLLGAGKWNKSMEQLLANPELGPAQWVDSDFNGDQLVNFDDIRALLATGLWNAGSYTYPSAKGAAAAELDGTVDLIVVPGGGLYIDTNGSSVSSYKINSAFGEFDGESADNLGLFQDDTDFQLAGGIGFSLRGLHFLGDVIGSKEAAAVAQGLSGTYTIDGVPGTFEFNVVVAVPEPGTLAMLATAALGLLLLAVRRRRKA